MRPALLLVDIAGGGEGWTTKNPDSIPRATAALTVPCSCHVTFAALSL